MAMRVNKRGGARTRAAVPDPEQRQQVERGPKTFSLELSKEEDQQTREHLTELLGKIQEQGKRLGSTPTFGELKSYRELVKKFMSEAVGNMYEMEAGKGWDRRGRQKTFSLVRTIDTGINNSSCQGGMNHAQLQPLRSR